MSGIRIPTVSQIYKLSAAKVNKYFIFRSDVFAAMFSHPETLESKNNVVEVEDSDPETIEQVIDRFTAFNQMKQCTVGLNYRTCSEFQC